MNGPELIVAVVFGLVGVRSLVYWLRRPMELDTRREQLLFALFVLARAGMWFALMGLFLLYASVETEGRAFIDDAGEFKWYFVVLLIPAALQFVAGFLLGRTPGSPDGDPGA